MSNTQRSISQTLAQQVGDGLEIYVVLARGRSPQGINALRGASVRELTGTADGERVFVIQQELKKD